MLCTAVMKPEVNGAQQPTLLLSPSHGTHEMYSNHSPRRTPKRGRGEEEGSSQPIFYQVPLRTEPPVPLPPPATPKKIRANTYEAPTTVKPSVLTAMGSLVGGSHQGDSHSSVPIRRRLSAGHIEEYVGGYDHMDTDNTGDSDSRPRSMSF